MRIEPQPSLGLLRTVALDAPGHQQWPDPVLEECQGLRIRLWCASNRAGHRTVLPRHCQHRALPSRPVSTSAIQFCSDQPGTSKIGPAQIGSPEIGSIEHRTGQVGISQRRLPEVGPLQIRSMQIHPFQVGTSQASPGQPRCEDVATGLVILRRVRLGKRHRPESLGQRGPDQLGPLQARTLERNTLPHHARVGLLIKHPPQQATTALGRGCPAQFDQSLHRHFRHRFVRF